MEQILHANGAPRHLVLVGRADAATGRADLACPLGRLARLVERHVIRQDQRTGFADREARAHVDARLLERAHSSSSACGDTTTPLPMKQATSVAQDARRDQVQHGLLPADDQRVAGVVAALEAHHALGVIGQPVDHLALAFVTPLGADHDYVACHCLPAALASCLQSPARRSSCRRAAPAAGRNQLALRLLVPGQIHDHDFAGGAQRLDLCRNVAVARCVRREDGRSATGSRSPSAASSRKSMVNPVAGRARPKALPTSS